MHLLVVPRRGRPEVSQQFYAPGKSYFDQNSQIDEHFKQVEGDEVTYHVGHGVMRTYRVAAIDDKTALLQQT